MAEGASAAVARQAGLGDSLACRLCQGVATVLTFVASGMYRRLLQGSNQPCIVFYGCRAETESGSPPESGGTIRDAVDAMR